jgi:prevent-host-death family protein
MSLIGVAEAKQRFSELLDRVGEGEHIVVARRGRPAVVLVPPGHDAGRTSSMQAPLGFATIAGALADLPEIEDVLADVNDARRGARDRPAPDLD